jgi:hypothetical protein
LTCGIAVVELKTGKQVGLLEFTTGCTELFDIDVIPGSRQALVMNLEQEQSQEAFTNPEFQYWLRPEIETPK